MSRKRQLPKKAIGSEGFRKLSRDARLLYLLLYTIADDEGRIREDPGSLAYELFPGETGFGFKIEALLTEIEHEALIGRYDVKGRKYIVIHDWDEQKVDHPKPSRLPAPPETRPLFLDELAVARAKRHH